jgi:hypothetical protein
MRSVLAVVGVVVAMAMAIVGAQTPAPADDLSKGIQQVKEGNFEGGLLTLDGVVSALSSSSDANAVRDRAQAHLYLGVAYVGLLQETPARKHFREALKLDKDLRLDPQQFPPRVVRVFEAARTGKNKSVLYAGGIGTAALIGGGAALLAGGSAAAGVGIVVVTDDTTTTTTTTTITVPTFPPGQGPPGPTPTRFTRVGQSNPHTFTQTVAGPTTATVFGPPGGDLGLNLCRGVATAPFNCSFAAVGGGGGTQSITAVLPAGTNTFVVQAIAFPPGETSVDYAFQIRTP